MAEDRVRQTWVPILPVAPTPPVCGFLSPSFLNQKMGTTPAIQQDCVQTLKIEHKVLSILLGPRQVPDKGFVCLLFCLTVRLNATWVPYQVWFKSGHQLRWVSLFFYNTEVDMLSWPSQPPSSICTGFYLPDSLAAEAQDSN